MIEIYCDGFSSPHKKNLAGMFWMCSCGKSDKSFLYPETTNNMAEYYALLNAWMHYKTLHFNIINYIIYTDSRVAISKAKKFLVIKDQNRHIKWIPREQNKAGIEIEKMRKGRILADRFRY